MPNPLHSEAEMFRFLLGTIVYFALVVVASIAGGAWWGLGVFVVLGIPIVLWLFGRLGR